MTWSRGPPFASPIIELQCNRAVEGRTERRKKMTRLRSTLFKARKAAEDWVLLKILRSEIKHELSSPPAFQTVEGGSLGDFVVDWDAPECKDVVLRRKFEPGEEVVVSALLGNQQLCLEENPENTFPREVWMKVLVKKPALSSVLQLNCLVEEHCGRSCYDICNVHFLNSVACPNRSAYRGPSFWTLDPKLHVAIKQYLVARGINENLTSFLLLHLHKKEQVQYVNWLQKVESLITKE